MRLLFDMSDIHAGDRFKSGLANYAYRSIAGFEALGYDDISVLCREEAAAELQALCPRFRLIRMPARRNWMPVSLDEGLAWRRMVNASGCDLLFRPFPVGVFKFLRVRIPYVMTIHDLQAYRVKKWYQSVFFKKYRLPLYIRRAQRVIAISDYVRGEILQRFPHTDPDKVKTVRNAIEVHEYQSVPIPVEVPYILTVNHLVPYKNVITLLRAFDLLKDRIPHKLVIVGKETGHYREVLGPFIEAHALSDRVVHVPFASEDMLYSLYERMDLFVTTSLLEGLGAAPVEAAEMGGPVISTRETALPESTMELVDYYEPATDPEALASRILETLSNPDTKRWESVKATFRRAYAYDARARELYDALLESASEKR